MADKKREYMFRALKPEEIDCRIGTINERGLTLLLYKDARVDMDILDETVGPKNWKREHSRDNANCVISIWDDDKKEWVGKEDTGVESNTEKEKGLASDSFKRSGVNWGIGRELYSAPFIYITSDMCTISKNDKNKYTCKESFIVKSIEYDDKRKIKALTINSEYYGNEKEVFVYPKKKMSTKKAEPKKETKAKAEDECYTLEKKKQDSFKIDKHTLDNLTYMMTEIHKVDKQFWKDIQTMFNVDKIANIKDANTLNDISILINDKYKKVNDAINNEIKELNKMELSK